MKTLSAIITSLAFAGPLTVASAVHAQDKASPSQSATASGKQDVTMDQLPSAVKTTVQREGKNKNIESITKSTDAKGVAAYEVKFLDGSKETTLDIAASGKVTSRHTGSAGTDSSQSSPNKDKDSDMKTQPKSTEPGLGDAKPDSSQNPQVPEPPNPPSPK